MSDVVLSLRDVSRVFSTEAEDLHILRSVDLDILSGRSSSISGPSGCGKSTLLSIMGGLDRPSSGTVMAGQLDLGKATETQLASYRSTVIGFVFQSHYLLKDFTALENAMLPAFMLSGDRPGSERVARELLDAVGLSARLDHTPARLSGGERQRVAIARALVNSPSVVLADEPTGSLDEDSARTVEELLFSVVAERGASLVLVTHDPRLAGLAEVRYQLRNGTLATV
ncbi:MAG: ABC transporter ATP-binding protein [Spirochaetales bacterium]|nr:ABC transporter ATP-binding protein [Spirochaetales bacterium]